MAQDCTETAVVAERVSDLMMGLSFLRTLKRPAERVGQLFGREGFVQKTGAAFKNPPFSQ
jgi:hypothetical protein